MLPAAESQLGYLPRMIDMDFSILENQAAPWSKGEDKQGYTGTPGYFSPEHLSGKTPTTASDVFTIGIILGELLCGMHPFAPYLDDKDSYREAVLKGGQFRHLTLLGSLGDSPANAQEFARLLEFCFDVQASQRPTAEVLHRALLELDKGGDATPHTPATPPIAAEQAAPVLMPPKLALRGDCGVLEVRLNMDMGSISLQNITTHAKFAERRQFRLERVGVNWYIEPCPGEPRNLTAWNGSPLQNRQKLSDGDTICLMGKASGKTAMELLVELRA